MRSILLTFQHTRVSLSLTPVNMTRRYGLEGVNSHGIPFEVDPTNAFFYNLLTGQWTHLAFDTAGMQFINPRFGYSGAIIPSPSIPQGQLLCVQYAFVFV